jgi:hypothetical protein
MTVFIKSCHWYAVTTFTPLAYISQVQFDITLSCGPICSLTCVLLPECYNMWLSPVVIDCCS